MRALKFLTKTKRFKFLPQNEQQGTIFCQSKCWLTQLVPAEIDNETGLINSFIIQTMDNINKDYKLYLLDLIDNGGEDQQIQIKQKIVEPNIKACYLVPCKDELPVIQTVSFHEDEYKIDFYVDS